MAVHGFNEIIVFAPGGFALCDGIEEGRHIRMGQALMRLPASRVKPTRADSA